MDKPIPAFYACYLLRSTVRHASLYVGSTPNPARRLRQHNGDAKGGAARTSRASLRPWEMTCLVTGFPSKIAALQFEWAWQNTHLTRHVSPDSRLVEARVAVRYSPKTGRARKRAARPRQSLSDRLSNLHLLLRASSFCRWPLKVTFYSADIHRVWQMCSKHHSDDLRVGVDRGLDESCRAGLPDPLLDDVLVPRETGIQVVDVSYDSMKEHLERSAIILGESNLKCACCHQAVCMEESMILTCPNANCKSIAHLKCLALAFLQAEPNADALVPTRGNCPGCGTGLHWADTVKELSLRMRAPDMVKKILRGKKRLRAKDPIGTAAANPGCGDAESDQEVDEPLATDDEWHYLSESDQESVQQLRTTSGPSRLDENVRSFLSPDRVIQDSDWDEVDIVT